MHDYQKLLEFHIRDLETKYNISITIHDRLGRLRNSHGTVLLPGRNIHSHPYCSEGRSSNSDWEQNCVEHCKFYVNSKMRQEDSPCIFTCWKGVKELAVPIYQHGLHLMTIFAGAFKAEIPEDTKLSRKLFLQHKRLPVLDKEKQENLTRLLYMLGYAILNIIDQINQDSSLEQYGRRAIINRCIQQNAHRADFRLKDLADKLYLSRSRTSHLVRELFNEAFQAKLLKERMCNAKALLTNSDFTIEEICETVGIPNIYYFYRQFKKIEGISPGQYRKQCKEITNF